MNKNKSSANQNNADENAKKQSVESDNAKSDNADREGGRPMDRRAFLKYSLMTSVIWGAGSQVPGEAGLSEAQAQEMFSTAATPAQNKSRAMFPQSVASGDPAPDGIVLWTRLAPQPRSTKQAGFRVGFEIATDASFRQVVLRGAVNTDGVAPSDGVARSDGGRNFIVKTQIQSNLMQPFTTYYYRFVYNLVPSPVGRFKTMPLPGDTSLQSIKFAYVSCQDYTNGFYNAYAALKDEDIDFVVHLGDYIYETTADASFQGSQKRPIPAASLPSAQGRATGRAQTVADYRFLYETYKSDLNLQAVHERFAFINIWDDHEFANDCYQVFDTDSNMLPRERPERREAGTQVWTEFTPTGVRYQPEKLPLDEITIYRSFVFGDLMELVMTDERLYRDPHPCGESTKDKYVTQGCDKRTDPTRSMLGPTQRTWFLDRIKNSKAQWKIWGNEVTVMQNKVASSMFPGEPGSVGSTLPSQNVFTNLDQWDGWPAERNTILNTVRNFAVQNFVTITGDIHSFIAGYLKLDFDSPTSPDNPHIGTEFVCGSITSSNLIELAAGSVSSPIGPEILLPPQLGKAIGGSMAVTNPHTVYFNSETHGYNIFEVSRTSLLCTMVGVDTIQRDTPMPNKTILKKFRVQSGLVEIIDETPVTVT